MQIDLDDEALRRQLEINCKRKKNLRCYIDLLLETKNADPFVLEIGAMDGILFDDLHEYISQYNMRGLMVEPLVDEYEKLVENYSHTNNRLKFANVAVTEHSGTQMMVRIQTKVDTPIQYRGMSSCFKDRNGLINLQDSCHTVRVDCLTLPELLEIYSVKSIDILQIDTEGYDYHILKQLDFSKFSPELILFETCCLPSEELNATRTLLSNNSYHLIQNGPGDCIASLFLPPVNVDEFYKL